MNNTWLALGSNEGNRMEWLQKAMELLAANCGDIIKKSSVYETAAWGITDQPDFLNMALQLQTTKPPSELLTAILQIETGLGRQRSVKWGPRTLDIDILLYNDSIIEINGLTIPHPFLHQRLFTLLPLAEIAPGYMHPLLHKTIARLLSDCTDKLDVHKINEAG